MFFSFAGHLPLHNHVLFVVASTMCGLSKHVYGGVYTIGGYDDGYFFPNMGGSVICGFTRLPRDCAFSHLLQCCPDFLIPFSV
jgi:hypothetical protein